MNNGWKRGMLAAAALALPASALAQDFAPAGYSPSNARQVGVSVSFPLGGGREESRAPQLEFRAVADHRAANVRRSEGGPLGWLPRDRPRETRIGITLAQQPRLTIAGREIERGDEKLGISTVGWVAIGVAAAVVVGGLLFVDALEDSSE